MAEEKTVRLYEIKRTLDNTEKINLSSDCNKLNANGPIFRASQHTN
jgi:hypothetical protein